MASLYTISLPTGCLNIFEYFQWWNSNYFSVTHLVCRYAFEKFLLFKNMHFSILCVPIRYRDTENSSYPWNHTNSYLILIYSSLKMSEDSHNPLFFKTNQSVQWWKYVQGHCLQHRLPIIKVPNLLGCQGHSCSSAAIMPLKNTHATDCSWRGLIVPVGMFLGGCFSTYHHVWISASEKEMKRRKYSFCFSGIQ